VSDFTAYNEDTVVQWCRWWSLYTVYLMKLLLIAELAWLLFRHVAHSNDREGYCWCDWVFWAKSRPIHSNTCCFSDVSIHVCVKI